MWSVFFDLLQSRSVNFVYVEAKMGANSIVSYVMQSNPLFQSSRQVEHTIQE